MYLVRMYCNQSPVQFKIIIVIEFKGDFKLITKFNVCNIGVKFLVLLTSVFDTFHHFQQFIREN